MYGASEIGTTTVVKIDGNILNTVGKAIKDCQIHIKNIDPNSAQVEKYACNLLSF